MIFFYIHRHQAYKKEKSPKMTPLTEYIFKHEGSTNLTIVFYSFSSHHCFTLYCCSAFPFAKRKHCNLTQWLFSCLFHTFPAMYKNTRHAPIYLSSNYYLSSKQKVINFHGCFFRIKICKQITIKLVINWLLPEAELWPIWHNMGISITCSVLFPLLCSKLGLN